MITSRNRWFVWAAFSGTAFLGSAASFFNLWAAVELGYDTSARGKSIIAVWSYAMLGLAVCGLGFAALALRYWKSARQT
jgi:hypothetical protein